MATCNTHLAMVFDKRRRVDSIQVDDIKVDGQLYEYSYLMLVGPTSASFLDTA